jgi:23S rRNA (adenine-N6)-dimethyltransferase
MKNNLSISQNFISNKNLIPKILNIIDLKKDHLILDIGIGDGAITEELLKRGYKVWAFELDKNFFEKAIEKFKSDKINITNQDFIQTNINSEINENFSVFSNIPFNLTTKIVQKLLINQPKAKEVYIFMQEEAANRFLGKKEGLLQSLLITNNYSSEIIYKFKKTDFTPVPKVNIVLMKFLKKEKPLIEKEEYFEFLDFISYIIMQQKPTIMDRLSKTANYYSLKELLKNLEIDPFKSLYDVPKNKYFELYQSFKKKYPLKVEIFKNSYQNYLRVNQSNKKIFKTRSK